MSTWNGQDALTPHPAPRFFSPGGCTVGPVAPSGLTDSPSYPFLGLTPQAIDGHRFAALPSRSPTPYDSLPTPKDIHQGRAAAAVDVRGSSPGGAPENSQGRQPLVNIGQKWSALKGRQRPHRPGIVPPHVPPSSRSTPCPIREAPGVSTSHEPRPRHPPGPTSSAHPPSCSCLTLRDLRSIRGIRFPPGPSRLPLPFSVSLW